MTSPQLSSASSILDSACYDVLALAVSRKRSNGMSSFVRRSKGAAGGRNQT